MHKNGMNIGEAAAASQVSAKMIRHYESIGVIPKAGRSEGGYRVYTASDVHTLGFVRRARDLGFSMQEIKKLVGLWRNKSRASAEVKSLALEHVKALEHKITELEAMAKSLRQLARSCNGDARPTCPILEGLAG